MAFEDYHNEDPFELDFDRDPEYGFGHGSYFGDRDAFEPQERRRHCDRCGTTGLHWEQTDNGWRLFNGRGAMHTCVNVNDALDLLPDLDEEDALTDPEPESRFAGSFKYTNKLTVNGQVFCPYCGNKAEWVSGRIIYPKRPDLAATTYYRCAPCSAHVGCHKGTTKPLGTLANVELRRLRLEAHMAFDPIWKDNNFTRTEAYKWMANQLGITPDVCHIGMFDIRMCERAIAVCMNAAVIHRPLIGEF